MKINLMGFIEEVSHFPGSRGKTSAETNAALKPKLPGGLPTNRYKEKRSKGQTVSIRAGDKAKLDDH